MSKYGLGDKKTINSFVKDKLERLGRDVSFANLFSLMFSEEDNIMYERSASYKTESFTYGEVKKKIYAKASALAKYDSLSPGCTVGIYMNNSLDWIALFWASILSSHSVVLLSTRADGKMLGEAVSYTDAKAVISDSKDFDGYGVKTIYSKDIPDGEESFTPGHFGEEIFVMSSGTGDKIKVCAYGAEEFYHQLIGSFSIIKKCRIVKKHYEGRLKLLTFLPFYHIFGLVAVYIWFSFFSRTFVELGDMSAQTVQNTIKRHKVTHIFAVPLFWELTYKKAMETIKGKGEKVYSKFLRAKKIYLKLSSCPPLARAFTKLFLGEIRDGLFGDSVIFSITGGGEIKKEILEFFGMAGCRLTNGYGMSETGICSLELSPSKKYLLGGYAGEPMQNVEYKTDESGRLFVRGKTMAKYVICGGEKRERDGWFDTHDLARIDGGHLFLLGRADDVVITKGGENLNPYKTEPLFALDGVIACALVDADGPAIVLQTEKYIGEGKLERLKSEAERVKSESALPADLKIICTSDPLIAEDDFKLNRRKIAKRVREGLVSEIKREGPDEGISDPLYTEIVKIITISLGKDEEIYIAPDSDYFATLGGTSLDYLLLVQLLGERVGAFPSDKPEVYNTPQKIYEYFKEKKD